MSQITLPAIRTAYALAATCSHGWATSLRWAGHDAREAAFTAAVENQDISLLSHLHLKHVEENIASGSQDWEGVKPSFVHVTGSGTLGWEVQSDGSAILTAGRNRYEGSGWDTRFAGRDVAVTVTATPGVWASASVEGDNHASNILRAALNAVQSGEPQEFRRMFEPEPVHGEYARGVTEVIRRPLHAEE